MKLHVFTNGHEKVIARDLEDLLSLFVENPGWPQPEWEWEVWEQEPDDTVHTIWCTHNGVALVPTEPHCNGAEKYTLTNAQWIEHVGRGHLCTSEW